MFQVRGLILFKTRGRQDGTGTTDSLTANLHFYCVTNHYFDDAGCNGCVSVREAEHVKGPLTVRDGQHTRHSMPKVLDNMVTFSIQIQRT